MSSMQYLYLAVSLTWGSLFAYLFVLDRQVRDVKKRLNAHQQDQE